MSYCTWDPRALTFERCSSAEDLDDPAVRAVICVLVVLESCAPCVAVPGLSKGIQEKSLG